MSIMTFLHRILGDSEQEKQHPEVSQQVQNYLDNRIREAVDVLAVRSEQQVRNIAKEKWKWLDDWKDFAKYGGWIVAAVMFFWGKSELRKHAEHAAREYLTKDVVHQVAMSELRSNVSTFVQTELSPLKKEIGSLEGRVEKSVERIGTVDSKLTELAQRSEAGLTELASATQLTLFVVSALGDDRNAVDELRTMEQDKASPYHGIAAKVKTEIHQRLGLERLFMERVGVLPDNVIEMPTGAGIDEHINKIGDERYTPTARILFVNSTYRNTNFKLSDRMRFLDEVLARERSERVSREAMTLMDEEAKLNRNMMGVKPYREWYQRWKQSNETKKPD
jgi:hypothetical protein